MDLRGYASKEELYFSWYLDELKQAGYVEEYYYERDSFTLCPPMRTQWNERLKTKVSTREVELLREHVYTSDFTIRWNMGSMGIFFDDPVDGCEFKPYFIAEYYQDEWGTYIESVVDVKSKYGHQNMNRLFSVNRKWVYMAYDRFINKVIPEDLFKRTFTPERYLYTDKKGSTKKRKIDFHVRTLNEYLKEQDG